jgi:diguanylate cyclase (GGDEF)-like protein
MLQGRLDTLKKTGITFGLFLIAIDQSQNIADFLDTTVFTSKEYVLEVVRHRVLKAIRGQDRIGLWGTYVLMVITNNIADSNIKAVGERLIKAVCSSDLSVDSDVITPTVSVGATVAGAGDTVTLIIKRADKAMNQSLASGGNRISII